jgi:hypothetical protein
MSRINTTPKRSERKEAPKPLADSLVPFLEPMVIRMTKKSMQDWEDIFLRRQIEGLLNGKLTSRRLFFAHNPRDSGAYERFYGLPDDAFEYVVIRINGSRNLPDDIALSIEEDGLTLIEASGELARQVRSEFVNKMKRPDEDKMPDWIVARRLRQGFLRFLADLERNGLNRASANNRKDIYD